MSAEPRQVGPILTAVYRGRAEELAARLAERPVLTVCEAAAVGDPVLLREAVRVDPGVVSSRSPDGWPALHLAAHFGRGDAVDVLLAAGADVRARADNEEANTALHAALAGRGDLRIVTLLLARAADGRTALVIAEDKGHAQAARRLRGEMP